ncbi:unnamed protein product [Arctogadus glacialis]
MIHAQGDPLCGRQVSAAPPGGMHGVMGIGKALRVQLKDMEQHRPLWSVWQQGKHLSLGVLLAPSGTCFQGHGLSPA